MPSDWANNEARKLAELLDDPETMRLGIAQMLDLALVGGLLSAAKIMEDHLNENEGIEVTRGVFADLVLARAKEIQDAI